MAEVKSSKVTAANNILDKETKEHKSFVTQNGILWCHWIQFENGDVGKYNSKNEEQVKFVVGQVAFYTIETKEGQQFTETIIKPATEVKRPKTSKGIDTMKQSSKMSSFVSALYAYITLSKNPASKESMCALAEKFHIWCNAVDDNVQIAARKTALTMAVQCMEKSIREKLDIIDLEDFPLGVDNIGLKTSDDLLALAEYLYTYSLTE
jgi:hypothetical protein